jgi:hypothetical protein
MRNRLRILPRLFALLCVAVSSEATNAENATIRIEPSWEVRLIQNQVPFMPMAEPTELLSPADPDDAFDSVSGKWNMVVGPLDNSLTSFSVQIVDKGSEQPAHPAIFVTIPRARKLYLIPVPLLQGESPQSALEIVSAAFNSGIPKKGDVQELHRAWLESFLSAEYMIDSIIGREPIDRVALFPPLLQALTVYADSAGRLIDRTSWFGIPRNYETRMRLIDRVERRAKSDKKFSKQSSVRRLISSASLLKKSSYQIESRVWKNIEADFPTNCMNAFPDSLFLYEKMNEMPSDTYNAFVENVGVNKTLAVNAAIACFEYLMSKNENERWFADVVVEEDLKGRNGPDTLSFLKAAAIAEAYGYGRTIGDNVENGRCGSIPNTSARLLCSNLIYLKEVSPLLRVQSKQLERIPIDAARNSS